jgi:integrase
MPDKLPRYLFRREGSSNIYVRLQRPNQTPYERSLFTSDVKAAEIAAADVIKQHRAFIYQRRQARAARVVHGPWSPEYEPGLHTLPDGRSLIATATDLTFSDGTRRPNGGPSVYLTGQPLSAPETFKALDDAWDGKLGEGPVPTERPTRIVKDADDALLETYIAHAGLNVARAREARDLLHTFKVVVGKPLKDATRDDGRALVAAMGNVKSATAKRKLVPLAAAVNLAINEGKHVGINPFVGVVADRGDSERRLPFDDTDIELIRANLGLLDQRDQLLVRTLATCGLRLSEAFSIDREHVEGGCRYVMVGEQGKTAQSFRRVPLPADLLKHMPKKITGPLFTGRPNAASTRLAKWLRSTGITDPNKTAAHSYRHRMQDRLRAVGCPSDLREEILGHERKTVAAGYGQGSPVAVLRKWLDKAAGF